MATKLDLLTQYHSRKTYCAAFYEGLEIRANRLKKKSWKSQSHFARGNNSKFLQIFRCENEMASYQVEFAYTGTEDDELTLQIGDIISDCVQKEDGNIFKKFDLELF